MGRTREKIIAGLMIGFALIFFGNRLLSAKKMKSLPASLVGTWRSACLPADSQHSGPYESYVVLQSSGNYEATSISYQDSGCKKAEMFEVFKGPLSVYEPNRKGLHEISWGISGVERTMLSPVAAARANKSGLDGLSDWKVNEMKNAEVTVRTYDIMKMQNDRLYFGDVRSGDMTSVKTRPDKLQANGYKQVVSIPNPLELAVQNASPCVQKAFVTANQLNAIDERNRRRKLTVKQRKAVAQAKARYQSVRDSSLRCLKILCKRKDSLACQMERKIR